MHNFDYIAVFDVDELVVPTDPSVDIPTLLDSIRKERGGPEKAQSFHFQSWYFPPSQKETDERCMGEMLNTHVYGTVDIVVDMFAIKRNRFQMEIADITKNVYALFSNLYLPASLFVRI